MSVWTSDAAFELHGACEHSLRFSFAAPVGYPYAPAEMADENPPPVLFRRIQAASPPPTRQGAPWHTGLTLDGKPFLPDGPTDRLAHVQHPEGAANLDTPAPDTVILNWMFDIPRHQHTITAPGDDENKLLLSIPYWNPAEATGQTITQTVDYYATHRVEWTQKPETDWVAVSFDDFFPKDRDSADILIPLGECDQLCRN
ncbi:hypothetical protein [Actinoplanes sp. M2I2]|uniref:hypothetical protein n=1 Tax=Actinoplanes sp. M2I2 TaxID=1734444 RepID=UPI0020226361|nr:hypothetical protein [Actinoplanes sp. M2I2]